MRDAAAREATPFVHEEVRRQVRLLSNEDSRGLRHISQWMGLGDAI
jgi:hypothetical protein